MAELNKINKKYLKKLKRFVLSDKEKELFCKASYLVKAKIYNRFLIVSIFGKEHEYIVFCQKHDYITYKVDEKKWSKEKLNGLIYTYSENVLYLENSENIIHAFTDKMGIEKSEHYTALTAISLYQSKVRFHRLHDKELTFLNNQMRKFNKKVPDDYESFVRNSVFDSEFVMLYDKKKKYANCTKCGLVFHLRNLDGDIKHNDKVKCPHCGSDMTAKSMNKFLVSDYEKVKWSLLIQRDKDSVLFRYFRHILNYQDSVAVISSKELLRDELTKEKLTCYQWGRYKNTDIICWRYYKDPTLWTPQTVYTYPIDGITLYKRSIDTVERTPDFKYSGFSSYFKGHAFLLDSDFPVKYLVKYIEFPNIEKFSKLGYQTLVRELINSYRFLNLNTILDKKESNFLKSIKFNRKEFRILNQIPKSEVTFRDLALLQHFRGVSEENFFTLRELKWIDGQKDKMKAAMRYATLNKILSYISKNCPESPGLYFDYLELREKLEHPAKDSILYPKNLKRAHDRYVAEWNAIVEKKKAEELALLNKQYIRLATEMSHDRKYHFENDKYSIFIPRDKEDFKKEGDGLNHCVYTNYFKPAATGKTMIFFVRQKENMEKSFFTVEIKDGKVRQCYGVNNKTPEELGFSDVTDFVREFNEQLAA